MKTWSIDNFYEKFRVFISASTIRGEIGHVFHANHIGIIVFFFIIAFIFRHSKFMRKMLIASFSFSVYTPHQLFINFVFVHPSEDTVLGKESHCYYFLWFIGWLSLLCICKTKVDIYYHCCQMQTQIPLMYPCVSNSYKLLKKGTLCWLCSPTKLNPSTFLVPILGMHLKGDKRQFLRAT